MLADTANTGQNRPQSFEVWRLVLVGRLILNTVAIVLNLLACLLLDKLCRRRKSHTGILSLLYLSYAELSLGVTSQLFSVLFLASHNSEEDHAKTSPLEHNKAVVLAALASSGSLKHSSLFLRQWWVSGLVLLHCLTCAARHFRRPWLAVRLSSRVFLCRFYRFLLLLGVSFGAVRLLAEKIPEYFRAYYIAEERHTAIHRVLYALEFHVPPLLTLPGCLALALLLWLSRRPATAAGGKTATAAAAADDDDDLAGPQLLPMMQQQDQQHQHQSQQIQQQQQQPQPQQVAMQLTWSWKCSQLVLTIGLLFIVCQGPLIFMDRVDSESLLYINLQDLAISLFGCLYFAVLAWASSAFRQKLAIMCTCTVTPVTAEQADTVLDSCCQMDEAN